MALMDRICLTCQSIISPELGSHAEPDLNSMGWITPPGQTFDTFSDAVLKNCIICSTVRDVTKQHRNALSAEAWRPMQYKAERPETGETIVRLHVLYMDPLKKKHADLRFRLVATDDKTHSSRFAISDLEASTSSQSTLDMACEWFHSCHSGHPSCGRLAKLSAGTLPTRLIDIGHEGDMHWTLRIVRDDDIPSELSYITLSYRWGQDPKLLLLSSNMAELRRPCPIEQLPRTFRDAVTVTRRLGVRYIWIDALCIVQDSITDWKREAPTMTHVYANSACNIAASASSNPEEGMFRQRDPKDILPRSVTSSLFTDKLSPHYIFEKGYWDRQIQGPLHNRGWVFQERFLAPRVLYFGRQQVLWECLSEHKCEGFPRGIPAHYSDKSVNPLFEAMSERTAGERAQVPLFVFNLWNDLVKQYSRCDLTWPSDKLFAMAGIARLFREITGDEYVAGWWKSLLLESLDWRVFEPRPRRGKGYRAPSWSWASVDSPVRMAGVNAPMHFLVKLVDVHVTAQGSDVLTDILDARLILRGMAFTAICHYHGNGNRFLQTEKGELRTWLYPDSEDTEFPEGKEFLCIPYKRDYSYNSSGEKFPQIICFIAEEVATGDGNVRCRRLGFFILREKEQIEKFATGWASSEITLV